jgi:hypothetical protein
MYNLTVGGAHTFFVGEQRWLVHNSSCVDDYRGHLTLRDLQAARAELMYGTRIPKPGGGYWDHLKEVTEAQAGLQRYVEGLKRKLSYVRLSPADRAVLERELGEASRLLDFSRRFVP